MANGKIVHYKRVYKVTIEGKTDTAIPDEVPMSLKTSVTLLYRLVSMLDDAYKWRSVKIKEVKR